MVDVERERERRRGGVGEKGEGGVVVTEGGKKIKGRRRGGGRGEAMERGMDWEGKGRESGGGRWVGERVEKHGVS